MVPPLAFRLRMARRSPQAVSLAPSPERLLHRRPFLNVSGPYSSLNVGGARENRVAEARWSLKRELELFR